MSEPRRLLTFSSLFPSSAWPRHGIFVQTRLLQFLRSYPLDARVVAPVPWFPFKAALFGEYAKMAATPRGATLQNGLQVSYPRYLMLPRIGVALQPDSMARAALGDVVQFRSAGWQPDLIDAHYFYPDGVAAAIVAERLSLPLVITARGTDVNVLARLPGPGRRILWAGQRADAVIAVSEDLKRSLVGLGLPASKIVVLRNGVDAELFVPTDQIAARERLGLDTARPLAICVGNLVEEKGFELALEALAHMRDWQLLIVGEGPSRKNLEAYAHRLGVVGRVLFHRNMPQRQLVDAYGSADVLLLTSTREGWPNVVLEALACGTPVVAVDVGAVAEMLTDSSVGRIVPTRDPRRLAATVYDLLQSQPNRDHISTHARQFDWPTISRGQWEVFERVCQRQGMRAEYPLPCNATA